LISFVKWLGFVRHCYDVTRRRDVTVDERDLLADRFEANRTHLRALASTMLGSVSEADDAVQEAWLRLSRSQAAHIENLRKTARNPRALNLGTIDAPSIASL
jgi:DNA-directed RNA polymerase specialized sigma24 family protein